MSQERIMKIYVENLQKQREAANNEVALVCAQNRVLQEELKESQQVNQQNNATIQALQERVAELEALLAAKKKEK